MQGKFLWEGKTFDLTLAETLSTKSFMIPISASWVATFSLLIEPTQGLCMPNNGATFL